MSDLKVVKCTPKVIVGKITIQDVIENNRLTQRNPTSTELKSIEKCVHEVRLEHEKERGEILRRALLQVEGLLAAPQVNYSQCSMAVSRALMEHARKAYR